MLATRIVNHAKQIGLNVCYVQETPGDGNCMYHSIIQSLNNYGLSYAGGHIKLRNDVVNTVITNANNSLIYDWIQVERVDNPHFNLQKKCDDQRSIGIYGDELFLRGASILLQIPILVTDNSLCNRDRKYTIFWPEDVGEDINKPSDDEMYILLGNCKVSQHFLKEALK